MRESSGLDFKAATLVSLDDDRSALRFKPVEDIKAMKRKTPASEKGKERIRGN